MAVVPIPTTLVGLDAALRAGTTVLGFLTALVGLGTAVLIFIWWWRRNRQLNQRNER